MEVQLISKKGIMNLIESMSSNVSYDLISDKIESAKVDLRREYNLTTETMDRTMKVAFEERDKAVSVANEALDKRMNAMNEFRAQLSDQAAKFITRPEHDVLVSQINQTQLILQGNTGKFITRDDMLKINSDIEKLRDLQSMSTGRSVATNQIISFGITGIAVLFSIFSFAYNGHSSNDDRINALSARITALTPPISAKITP